MWAQAPGLLWTTNVGARLFAVDEQTNVYANAGGTVIKLNASGVPLQTNAICPNATWAQRDSTGNLYFAGVLPGTFVGSGYDYGTNNACFAAKFTSGGGLVWSNVFGPTGFLRHIDIRDLQLDGSGDLYIGFTYYVSTVDHISSVAKFDQAGGLQWTSTMPKTGTPGGTIGAIRLAELSPTNGYVITYVNSSFPFVSWGMTLSSFDVNGAPTTRTNWYEFNGPVHPLVTDSRANFFSVEGTGTQGSYLTKRTLLGGIIWRLSAGYTNLWTVGPDLYDGVHVADDSAHLRRYDSDGNPAWTMALTSSCTELILDNSGNRFLSLSSGAIARIADETQSAPVITNAPQPLTVLAGSNAVFSVGVTGFTPLRYFWFFGTNSLPGQTNPELNLPSVTTTQAGPYSVIVSNMVNSVTSAPVLLRVKNVAVFVNNQLLTNGTYVFSNAPTISIRSAFVNGSSFYTLDGSAPSFASTPYSGSFMLSANATIRALGYSSDFSQSEEADAVNIIVPERHTLSVSTPGGGIVASFPSNCIPSPAGLVTSWRGEGNTLDSIGTNHGVTQGSLSYAQGEVGRAFMFDGNGGIVVASNSVLNVGSGSGMTVEFWFNWNGTTWAPLVQWSASYQLIFGDSGIVLLPPGNLKAGFGSPWVGTVDTASGVVSSNTPHHAAFTYDKSSGLVTIYLDGGVAAQQNLGVFTPNTRGNLYLGTTAGVDSYPGGWMDEISVFNRALSAAEILSIYQAGHSGKCVPADIEGSYLPAETLVPTAAPLPGYSFLYWLGDASGTNPTANISMERDKSVKAVFGTTLSTTVAGSGHVDVSPSLALYPYGSTVQLTAIPDPGNYFGFWGNAATGNTNPLYFTITAPTQTVSSIFGPTPGGQAALTVISSGSGRVNVSPQANAYALNTSVTMTAVPDGGQTFINWSGDASGSQNPLNVSMTQSKVITANFSKHPVIGVGRPGVEGLNAAGFRLTLTGEPPSVFQIFGSSNLLSWDSLGFATNIFGEVQFTDTNAPSFPKRFYKSQLQP